MSSPKGHVQSQRWSLTTLGFHACALSIYGYAICWQNVSRTFAGAAKLIHPALRPYGRLKFLTYNCLLLQFAAYSLCLASHFVPRLRKTRDFFLTTLAMPISALVCISFWGVWLLFGQELIFPVALQQFYPDWLNHATHTIVLPVNLIELYLVKHEYSSSRSSLLVLFAYTTTYGLFLLYLRLISGLFVYPFLNEMNFNQVTIFLLGVLVAVFVFFFTGKALTKLFHRSSTRKTKSVSASRQVKKSN